MPSTEELLTCHSEAPKVHDIRQPNEDGQARHLPAAEKHHVTVFLQGELLSEIRLCLLDTASKHRLSALNGIVFALDSFEGFHGQPAGLLVDLGNVANSGQSLVISTFVDEELGGFPESEDKESHDENEQCDATNSKQ
jgi:hypothetical protein